MRTWTGKGSRYSVPWQYAGKEVWVQEIAEEVDIRTGRERIAMHGKARRKHEVVTFPAASSRDSAGGAKGGRQDPDSPAAERAGGGEAFAGGV